MKKDIDVSIFWKKVLYCQTWWEKTRNQCFIQPYKELQKFIPALRTKLYGGYLSKVNLTTSDIEAVYHYQTSIQNK